MSSEASRSESPSFLDSPPPGSAEDLQLEPTQRLPDLPDSETFTQQEIPSNSSVTTLNFNTITNDRTVPDAQIAGGSNRTPIWNPDASHMVLYQHNVGFGHQLRLERYVPNEDSDTIDLSDDNSESNSLPVVEGTSNVSSATLWPISEHSMVTNVTEISSVVEFPLRENEQPPAKLRRISSPEKNIQKEEDQDGETCPICLEPWGNSGEHRLVALKCGHLFGYKCVERWLRAQPVRDRSCPTCKTKATVKDLRFIYARRLIAADTAEVTSLQRQVESLQAEKSRAELELQKSKMAHRACLQQLEVLRSTIATSSQSVQNTARRGWRFALEKNLEVCKNGRCRVMAYNCRSYDLYVSQKSTNNLFPGFGVRRVSCVDYNPGQFLHLHPKPIRDIAYSQPRDLLLSVSLDGSARLVERGIASLTIQSGTPLWSCSWDALRHQELYLGGVGGNILQYDIRNTSSPLHRLLVTYNTTPVVSLCSTEYGLLSCQLNTSILWRSNGGSAEWEPKELPVEGPFLSMAYDSTSNRALVSCRPKSTERSRLQVCKLTKARSGDTLCQVENSFYGSVRATVMSRAAWVHTEGATWAAAHSESDSALFLHGLDGSRTMSLPAVEPALDVCAAQVNGDTILAALSESRLRLYKAVPTNL